MEPEQPIRGKTHPLALAALLAALLLIFAAVRPACATEPFAYRWQTDHVELRWHEGSGGAADPALRAMLGHWKRLAESVWRTRGTGRLRIDASFYGRNAGSPTPRVSLQAPAGSVDLTGGPGREITEDRFLAALSGLAAGDPTTPSASFRNADREELRATLPDDTAPRLSPGGRWVAFRSWQGGRNQVWVAALDGQPVFPCEFPNSRTAGAALSSALLGSGPEWSPDGRCVAFLRGGRLAVVDVVERRGRVLNTSAPVLSFDWSPNSRHIALQLEDGGLLILDRSRDVLIPLHKLFDRLTPEGELAWSPSGTKLLFRAYAGISVANSIPASGTSRALGRLADLLFFRRTRNPPRPTIAGYEDRLLLLDLAHRQVASAPLSGTLLADRRLDGLVWRSDEASVYLAGRSDEDAGSSALIKLSLPDATLSTVTGSETRSQLRPLGPRLILDKVRDPRLTPATEWAAFAEGDRLMLVQVTERDRITRPTRLTAIRLAPGPDGGYLGVEDEAITENEPAQTLLTEDSSQTSAAPARLRLPEGLYLSVNAAGKMFAGLRSLIETRAAVDLDVDPLHENAVVALSEYGGASELVLVRADGRPRRLRADLPTGPPEAIRLIEATLPMLDAGESLAALAAAFDPHSRRPAFAALAAALAVLVLLLRRVTLGRRRKRTGGPA